MKRPIFKFSIFLFILLLCFTLSCQQTAEEPAEEAKPVVDVEADIGAINEIWSQYVIGGNTGDLDLWISLWDDDGIRMAPDTPAVFGKDQIRTQMTIPFEQFTFEISVTPEENQVAGDWAFSRGTYTLSLTPKAGGETSQFSGKFLTILKKQADGSWKIARDCFNYDAPSTSTVKE